MHQTAPVTVLEQVQAGIDFIEANLDFDISISEVARQVGLSQWHFQRIFKALSNETLKTYIRSRRMARSLDKLATTETKIIDIAMAAGYESQESFTRAFREHFGLTPNQYRRLGQRRLFPRKPEFSADYLRHINSNVSLMPDLYRQQSLRLVGLRTCFYGADSEKNNLAEKLPPLWEQFLARMSEIDHAVTDVCYGVVRELRHDTDQLEYLAAVEVRDVSSLPEGMVQLDVPQSEYARFTHDGNIARLDDTVNYIYGSWLLTSGKWHNGGPDLEMYGAEYAPLSDSSRMSYAIPID